MKKQESIIIAIIKVTISLAFIFMFCCTLLTCGIMKGKIYMETENTICQPKNSDR